MSVSHTHYPHQSPPQNSPSKFLPQMLCLVKSSSLFFNHLQFQLNPFQLVNFTPIKPDITSNNMTTQHRSPQPFHRTTRKMSSRQPFPINSNPLIFLAVSISASLIILFSILYFLYFLWCSLVKRSRTSPFDATTPLNKLQRFSYNELKNATHNFNDSNCIGKGGSGSVFTGMLKDGKLVAVKLLDSNSFQCEQEFQNELKILGGLNPCSFVVSLLGFCVEKGKSVLVYEYLPNKSLQESLFFDCNNLGLNWSRRFSIVLDVAKALAFLHLECDPPVIHGDVKPSNVLLDIEFRAKLSDFGLSRLKFEGEFGVDLFSQDFGKSQDLWKSQELSGKLNAGRENESTPIESHENDEVDFALALQASSSSKNSCKIYNNLMGSPINSLNFNFKSEGENDKEIKNLKGKELSIDGDGGEDWNKSLSCDDDFSMDHSKGLDLSNIVNDDSNVHNLGANQWGKDWWWRQDGSGELCSKDYVKEWIGSQICDSTDNWDEEKGAIEEKIDLDNSPPLEKFEEVNENPIQESGFEYLNGTIKKEDSKRWRVRAKKHRKMHEWWKEENLEEVKSSRKANVLEIWSKKRFKEPHFGLGKRFHFRRKRRKFVQENENMNDPNMEFSVRKGWRKKKSRSSDMWSGDLFSRELSSTTSMRGTLCYVAPEYAGCGYLMEKADIYSFGVLILVIVSGRRPLHILSSPMKLEKANLISWARQLAHNGNILELVDEKLRDDFDKEEAGLCINLAHACLQKMPELRPDIGDVVKILKGEMELPQLPFEFSPSPPSKCFGRSRRRQKSVAE